MVGLAGRKRRGGDPWVAAVGARDGVPEKRRPARAPRDPYVLPAGSCGPRAVAGRWRGRAEADIVAASAAAATMPTKTPRPPCSHPGHPRRHPHIQVACQAEHAIREQRVRRCVAHAVCPNAQLLENEATSETAQSRCRGRGPSTLQPSTPLPSSPVSQKWGSATIHKGRAILMNICNFVLNCKV